MHIPDGLIPFPQWLIYYAISFIALIFALRWARNNLDERAIPLLAVLSAGIFAIQAMNIPIPIWNKWTHDGSSFSGYYIR